MLCDCITAASHHGKASVAVKMQGDHVAVKVQDQDPENTHQPRTHSRDWYRNNINKQHMLYITERFKDKWQTFLWCVTSSLMYVQQFEAFVIYLLLLVVHLYFLLALVCCKWSTVDFFILEAGYYPNDHTAIALLSSLNSLLLVQVSKITDQTKWITSPTLTVQTVINQLVICSEYVDKCRSLFPKSPWCNLQKSCFVSDYSPQPTVQPTIIDDLIIQSENIVSLKWLRMMNQLVKLSQIKPGSNSAFKKKNAYTYKHHVCLCASSLQDDTSLAKTSLTPRRGRPIFAVLWILYLTSVSCGSTAGNEAAMPTESTGCCPAHKHTDAGEVSRQHKMFLSLQRTNIFWLIFPLLSGLRLFSRPRERQASLGAGTPDDTCTMHTWQPTTRPISDTPPKVETSSEDILHSTQTHGERKQFTVVQDVDSDKIRWGWYLMSLCRDVGSKTRGPGTKRGCI